MKLGQYHTDAQDSELAGAVLIGPFLKTIHDRVLLLFKERGELTDEELRDLYDETFGPIEKNVIEPRRYELVKEGLVRRTDQRRKGKSGVGRIVWAYVRIAEQIPLL